MRRGRKNRNQSRQTRVGSWWLLIGLVGLGWSVIWLAPIWVNYLFPNFLISSVEPWQLTEADLNWQRMVSNLIIKPGFRMVMVGLYLSLLVLGQWWWKTLDKQRLRLSVPKRGAFQWNYDSLEFVVGGGRGSILAEFVRDIEQ